jgi:hypothetical protein
MWRTLQTLVVVGFIAVSATNTSLEGTNMKTTILSVRRLFSAFSIAAFLVAVPALPAGAAAPRVAGAITAPHAGHVTAVAKITGAGRAVMTDVGGGTLWWENKGGITLYSDGSAKGTFFCVDLPNSPPGYPGVIWGDVTSWTLDNGLISLHVPSSTLISWPAPWDWSHHELPPGPRSDGGSWRIQIQKFGGAGVGHWTLDVPVGDGNWFTFCWERVTGGKIALKQLDWQEGPGGNN